MSYDKFRQFADSWGLVIMALTYLTLVSWALLPRNRDRNRAAATMIFEDNDHG